MTRPRYSAWLWGWLAAGCAAVPPAAPALPFHVAIAPVSVSAAASVPREDEDAALALDLDAGALAAALRDHLEPAFTRVTLLESTPDDDAAALAAAAQRARADLILAAHVAYERGVSSSLNDRFWLNLLLFALGGPATWFVSDRSYAFTVRLEAQLFDVTAAAAAAGGASGLEETGARVLRLDRESREAALSFLDRADDVLSYGLSLVVPSGLLAASSTAASEELRAAIGEQLGAALAVALQERAGEIVHADLVAFYPEAVQVVARDGARQLAGDMVVEIGQADALASLRYRVDGGAWRQAEWAEASRSPRRAGRAPERRYRFRAPLPASGGTTVQLEVEQLDRTASRRTFTYPVAAGGEERP